MHRRLPWILGLAVVLIGLAARPGFAQPAKADPKEKEALAKSAEAFIEAFQKNDASAVAGFWAIDGEYSDQTGRQLKGRDAIEKEFKEFFATNKNMKLRIVSDSLRFLSPDVVIEEGMTEVYPADNSPPSRARYTNIHVKKDGKWQLSSVKEAPYVPPSNGQNLRALAWAIGAWASEGEKGPIESLTVAWDENENFIHANFATTMNDVSLGSALHWIVWDPETKRVRSWIFDSTGAFGEGAWTQDGKKWTIKTKTTLQDGKKATATLVVGPVDADTMTLQSKERSIGGEPVQDSKEIKLKRIK